MIENPFAPDRWRIGQDTGCIYPPFRPFDDFGIAGRWLTMAPAFEMVAERVWSTDPTLAELLLTISRFQIRNLILAAKPFNPSPWANPYMTEWTAIEGELYERLESFWPGYLPGTPPDEWDIPHPEDDPWTAVGKPLWFDVVPYNFNKQSWRFLIERMVVELNRLNLQPIGGEPFDVVKMALLAVAIHDDQMPLAYVPYSPDSSICAPIWPSEDIVDALAAAGQEWWDRYQELLPVKGGPTEVEGRRLTTGVLQKCKDPYEKSERPWCIYKHKESAHDETLKRQPKGWPKHYKTKKDAEKALRIMARYRDA